VVRSGDRGRRATWCPGSLRSERSLRRFPPSPTWWRRLCVPHPVRLGCGPARFRFRSTSRNCRLGGPGDREPQWLRRSWRRRGGGGQRGGKTCGLRCARRPRGVLPAFDSTMARRPRRFFRWPAPGPLTQDTAKRACRKAEFTAVHASADAYRESGSWQGRPKGNYSHEGKVCQPRPSLAGGAATGSRLCTTLAAASADADRRAGTRGLPTAGRAAPCTCSGPQSMTPRRFDVKHPVLRARLVRCSSLEWTPAHAGHGVLAGDAPTRGSDERAGRRVDARTPRSTACCEATRPLW